MAAPEVTLVDPKRFQIDTTVEAAEGETQVIINLPTAVPAGKRRRYSCACGRGWLTRRSSICAS